LRIESVAVLQPSSLGNRAEFRFGEKVGAFFMQTFSFVFQGNLENIRRLKVKLLQKQCLK
jgi:hypothetical protein